MYVWKTMLHWEAASEVRLKLHLVRYQGTEFVAGTSMIQRIGGCICNWAVTSDILYVSSRLEPGVYHHDFPKLCLTLGH